MGFSTFAILAGVFEMGARTLGGLVLVPWLGFLGVCCSNPLAWTAAAVFLIPGAALQPLPQPLQLFSGGLYPLAHRYG